MLAEHAPVLVLLHTSKFHVQNWEGLFQVARAIVGYKSGSSCLLPHAPSCQLSSAVMNSSKRSLPSVHALRRACVQVERCVQLLIESGRLPEAAMLARAYTPSRMGEPVKVGGKGHSHSQGHTQQLVWQVVQLPTVCVCSGGAPAVVGCRQGFGKRPRGGCCRAPHGSPIPVSPAVRHATLAT